MGEDGEQKGRAINLSSYIPFLRIKNPAIQKVRAYQRSKRHQKLPMGRSPVLLAT